MQTTDHNPQEEKRSSFRKSTRYFMRLKLLIAAFVMVFVVIIIALFSFGGGGSAARTETYKDIPGGAGLQASISYNVSCHKTPCDQKPTYDFNVYFYKEDGQQVSVVRPDKNGKVNVALSEGEYVMLIGKRFGNNKVFPEEPLALKNGQLLELKLHY